MTAVAVFGFTNVNAQDDKTIGGFAEGDIFIAGSASFSSVSIDGASVDAFSIAPSAGYFIKENIAVGLSISYSDATIDFDGDDIEASTFGGGVFGRYYCNPSSQFSFFGNLGVSYSTTDLGDADLNTFGVGLAPGISYFLSNNFAIEASVGVLGYSSSKIGDDSDSINTFSVGVSSSDLSFGLIYKF